MVQDHLGESWVIGIFFQSPSAFVVSSYALGNRFDYWLQILSLLSILQFSSNENKRDPEFLVRLPPHQAGAPFT